MRKVGEMFIVAAGKTSGKSFIKMPHFVMMIGLPASGKSTYAESKFPDYVRISSDDYIEAYALEQGKTYNEVFKEYIDTAQKLCFKDLMDALAQEKNIVLDRTCLSTKVRAKILKDVPDIYYKTAIHVYCSDENEYNHRLNNRPGKNIPIHILETMKNSFQDVVPSEGFDQFIKVDTRID